MSQGKSGVYTPQSRPQHRLLHPYLHSRASVSPPLHPRVLEKAA